MISRMLSKGPTKITNIKFCVSVLALGACCISSPIHSEEINEELNTEEDISEQLHVNSRHSSCSTPHIESVGHLASKLVNTFWTAVVYQDLKGYSDLMTKNYQGLKLEGFFNKYEQVANLRLLTLLSYTIEDLNVADFNKDTLVISYNLIGVGPGFVSGPNIDVWSKINGHWKLVSHTFLPFPS